MHPLPAPPSAPRCSWYPSPSPLRAGGLRARGARGLHALVAGALVAGALVAGVDTVVLVIVGVTSAFQCGFPGGVLGVLDPLAALRRRHLQHTQVVERQSVDGVV